MTFYRLNYFEAIKAEKLVGGGAVIGWDNLPSPGFN
jgi:hypothetical protein